MKGSLLTKIAIALVVVAVLWTIPKYNSLVTLDEGVNQAWAQVENAYQRRFDLIPNLVETVKGYAKQEKEVLVGVTEARAKVGGMINLGADVLNDPAKLQQFQEAQGSISSALQRLMVVVEQYPELKSDQNFRDLQAQLEGTENRIAVERGRFNEVVKTYNETTRQFPATIVAALFGFVQKPYFESTSGAEKAPEVKF